MRPDIRELAMATRPNGHLAPDAPPPAAAVNLPPWGVLLSNGSPGFMLAHSLGLRG
jgi:hypothetical protein